jgi:PAS domain S-box-containing protein
VLCAATLCASAAAPKRVLLLHSFGREFAPFNTFSEAFRTALSQQLGYDVEFHDVALESARGEGEASEGPLVDYLTTLFGPHGLDLVVTIGGPAARFAQKYRPRLFPSTPLLFASVDERHLEATALTTNDAIVAARNDPVRALNNMLQVLPETTNVVVVLGSSPLEKFWLGELRREFQPFTNRVSLVWLNELSFTELLKRVANLPRRSAIYYAVFSVDAEGVPFVEERALRRVHEVANAPIFGMHDTQMGQGIVGGPLLAIEDLGRMTAKVGTRILKGEPAGSIKTPVQGLGLLVYDWRELKRWHINEARLPAGSVIRFRQPTTWEEYKWRIIGILMVCLAEALLIVLLLLNLVRRRRAEGALRESEERFSLATAAADLGVWAWDMYENRVWVSENWSRIFRMPPGADIGFETVLERVHPDDCELVQQAVKRAIEQKEDYVVEYRIALPDGTQRWIAARGRLHPSGKVKHDRLLGVSVDITERKQAEQALRQSEQRLSLAVAAAGVGVWEWDVAQNRFWATESWLHIFGYRPGEITRPEQMLQRLHPEDRAAAEHSLRRAIEDHADYKDEYRVVLPDQTERWIASRGRLYSETDAKAGRMLGAAVDITDRKRAIDSLRRLQEQNELLLTSAAEGILGLDLRGNHTFVNPAAARMLGYTTAELLRRCGHDTWHHTRPDGSPYPSEECLICAALRDGAVRRVSNEVFWRKDGTSFPVEYISTPIFQQDRLVGAVVTFQDVTARKAAEQALQQSEERFRQVAENVADFIWEVDATGLYRYTSPSVERILGYTPDELIGKKHFYDLFAPNVREELKAAAFEVFAAKQVLRAFPNPNVSKQGQIVHLETSGVPVLDGAGALVGYRGADTDVTHRKAAEQELQQQQEELAHVSRVSVMGELAASVAHELNQPLGAILSNAEAAEMFLAQDPPAVEELRDILADIRKDDERAGEVIRRMRALLRKGEQERQPLQINYLVEDVFRLVAGNASLRTTSLGAELTPDLPLVSGDRIQLQQVLLNLILNALEAMAKQPPEKRRLLVCTSRASDGEVEVSVTDSGPGLEAANLPRLFEPFFTTKQSGIGMGLPIARKIVEAHHGRIWAENHPAGGAIFRFRLPGARGEGRGARGEGQQTSGNE